VIMTPFLIIILHIYWLTELCEYLFSCPVHYYFLVEPCLGQKSINDLGVVLTHLHYQNDPLYLLFLVRLEDYIVNLWVFYFYKLIGKSTFFYGFRSSTSTFKQWTFPLPLYVVLLPAIIKDCQYSYWDYGTPDYFEYRRHTFTVKITHSPITFANISFINLVSIFRCSSPTHNPVYTSRVHPSVLAFSLSSHRHTDVSLLFSSRFVD
jgi:hypothetical protein